MGLDEKAWQDAHDRIARAARAAGRNSDTVRLVAVSKTQPAERVLEAYKIGQRVFGENYVQEAAAKRAALGDLAGIEWRLIGPLQGNKAAEAAAVFDAVESVDRLKIAERLSAARSPDRKPLEVLVQVNISGEATKSGASPGDAVTLARQVAALPRLRLRGFMGIAEPTGDERVQRAQFATLARCLDAARAAGLDVSELSMGMTADLEAAVAEGATEVRLGTALFGARETGETMITFIGGGNMANAIAGGLIARGRPARDIAFVDPVDAQRAKLEAAMPGARTYATASAQAVEGASIVVLAVKPQQMREACAALAPHVAHVPVVLSIAAGTRSRDIARWLGGYDRIVRAMPDTPSLIGAGIAGLWSAPSVKPADRAAASAILEACGGVVPVAREEALDAVTGISASGVAYVFYFIEALEAAARAHGFDAKDARALAYATFDGAVKLALASDEDPATLRARVTSKAGTTERGIAALETAKVREAIASAVDAATKRAAEMGEQMGREG